MNRLFGRHKFLVQEAAHRPFSWHGRSLRAFMEETMKSYASITPRAKGEKKASALTVAAFAMIIIALAVALEPRVDAGQPSPTARYQVLAPITHGNLTIFPVVAASVHDANFLTLDEGLRSGEVVVSEAGSIQPLIRGPRVAVPRFGGPQVNTLVLVNNSDRPLLLLAGEIVTGGHQDRVVGKDRIVPAQSDPIELGVFCVEPGRWTGASAKFSSLGAQMAQPSVRAKAMVDKNQQAVWDQVYASRTAVAAAV